VAYDVEAVVPERMRTRQRILQAALELFCAEGFDGASLRQLADQLQFTPAALYYHFASKADILHAVVAPLLDDLDEVLEGDFSTGGRSADRQRLSRLIDVLLEHRDIVALLARDVTASRMSGVRERLEAQSARLTDAFAGEERDPARLVRITAALGAVRRPIMDLPHLDLAEHRDTILDSAVAALNPPARRHKRPAA
jgi:AcrR family transcriptional regulator